MLKKGMWFVLFAELKTFLCDTESAQQGILFGAGFHALKTIVLLKNGDISQSLNNECLICFTLRFQKVICFVKSKTAWYSG